MLARPINLILISLLSIINFTIILLPFYIMALPFYIFASDTFVNIGTNILYMFGFVTSLLMLLYILLDMCFGFTVKKIIKPCTPFRKAKGLIDQNGGFGMEQSDMESVFEEAKKKFAMPKVELYIAPSLDSVNAYAVGSFKRNVITITMGLIMKIKGEAKTHDQYIDAIRGIIGHEMSHLINKDFMPALLMFANESATRYVSKVVRFVFVILANMFKIIPFIGRPFYKILMAVLEAFEFLINVFYRFVFMPFYNFMQKYTSRSIEYRCDREAGYAFGGRRIATGLSFLGKGRFFTVFSTHPGTDSRIKKVQKVMLKPGSIRPGFITSLSNFASIASLAGLCIFFAAQSDSKYVKNEFMNGIYNPISYEIEGIQENISGIYYRFFSH